MFVVKNAWKSVTRNKGRNMLIIVIVTIIFRVLISPLMHKQTKSSYQMQKVPQEAAD